MSNLVLFCIVDQHISSFSLFAQKVEVNLVMAFIMQFYYYSYGILTSCSDYRSTVAPSDSDRDCPSRRDSDPLHHAPSTGGHAALHQPPRLGIIAPSADSESGDGSHSPSPRASRRRTKIRNHSLTSLCLLSHHPFFSTFRECLFILKKLISACNESSSPKSVGASRQAGK